MGQDINFITYILSKKYTDAQVKQAKKEGFKVQVEQNRSILEGAGQEKLFYFLPKESENPNDGYDEYIYTNNNWEWVGHTNIDLTDYYNKNEVDILLNDKQKKITINSSFLNLSSEGGLSFSDSSFLRSSAVSNSIKDLNEFPANSIVYIGDPSKFTNTPIGVTVGQVVTLKSPNLAADESYITQFYIEGVRSDFSSEAPNIYFRIIVKNNRNQYYNRYGLWKKIGADIKSININQDGTITLTLSDNSTVTSTGKNIITEHQDISEKENTSARVTSVSSTSDNSHYPTAKAVWDAIQVAIGGIENGTY